jgi:dienelactone hydrolase
MKLTRREALLLPVAAYAQSHFPGLSYRDYPRCLPDYLADLAEAAREKRDAEIALLTTPEAIRERQRWARKTLLELIGPFPEKTDLNARTLGSFVREGYRVERIVYESRPKLYVSANLYIPTTGNGPYPGVLFQLGHSDNGKVNEGYQRACQGLAKLGFLVLAFDPMGQGERIYYPDATGHRSRLGSADEEHTLPGRQMLLVGTTATNFQLWDAIRSLDYLASHPMVDPKRLASAGQSGGATLTMLLAAVDDRLQAAAVMSGNTENVACRNFLPPGSTDDAEQDFVGSGTLGFDRWDLLFPFAPKPLLISVSDKDFFGTYSPNYVSDGWEQFGKLRVAYGLLGASENLGWGDTPLPHGLSYDSRLQMYNWLLRHLKDAQERLTEEPPTAPENEKTLLVSESGNMVKTFGGETPWTVTKQRLAECNPGKATRSQLSSLLRLDETAAPELKVLRKVPSLGGMSIAAVDVPINTKVSLPAWLFSSDGGHSERPLVLVLHPSGRNNTWREGGFCLTLAKQGYVVCAADVRGIGDLTPQFSPGAPGYARPHEDQENYAWGSLILGRPLVGQRVTDIIGLCQALSKANGNREICIAAFGHLTVPATFAAFLDDSIRYLYLTEGLVSFRSVIESEEYKVPLSDFVPGILQQTDIPDVVAQLSPKRVMLSGPIDARGATVPVDQLRLAYGPALAGGHVAVKERSEWSAQAVAEFLSGKSASNRGLRTSRRMIFG